MMLIYPNHAFKSQLCNTGYRQGADRVQTSRDIHDDFISYMILDPVLLPGLVAYHDARHLDLHRAANCGASRAHARW